MKVGVVRKVRAWVWQHSRSCLQQRVTGFAFCAGVLPSWVGRVTRISASKARWGKGRLGMEKSERDESQKRKKAARRGGEAQWMQHLFIQEEGDTANKDSS